MALFQRSLSAIRTGILSHIRLANDVPVVTGIAKTNEPAVIVSVSKQAMRFFAGGSSYLDKSEVTDRVLHVVKNFDKVDQSKISPSASFQKDLGLDSLDAVELVMAIEEEFAIEIPDSEADKILSCEDAISYISSNPMAK